jgi:hypothetical protein
MFRLIVITAFASGLFCGCATVRQKSMTDLTPTLQQTGGGNFDRILKSPDPLRAQILIAEVVTNANGKVELQRHGYRVDAEYFYPASSIKLCAAVAALQVAEKLQPKSLCPDLIDVPMEISPLFEGDKPQLTEPSNLDGGKITIAHEIRKLAIVSDNPAFNRFYDLVGHEALNRAMHDAGLRSTVINHRLSEPRTIPNMLASAEVSFLIPNNEPIRVPARVSNLSLKNTSKNLLVGNGYLKDKEIVRTPMDFSARNGISLVDLQNLMVKVARPDIQLGTPGLKLSDAHRTRLLQAMHEYPRESKNPVYTDKSFTDDYTKFLLPGIRRIFPSTTPGERIEIAGKIGRAYGFSVENCYVRNPANGRSVFVTAVIYTNEDCILNDDKYEYATVADPFFADLGELVARRWLK